MLKIPLRVALIAVAILGAAFSLAPAQAQPKANPPGAGAAADPIIASVGDRDIRLSELNAFHRTLPQQYRQMPLDRLFAPLRRQIIDTLLIARAAEAAGIDREPDVARQLEASRRSTLRGMFVARIVEKAVTADAMREAYEGLKSRVAGQSQVRASHILVATEREALAVIAELAKPGSDFAALARSRSTGPSGTKGGDLGFFARGDMVKPFADAAFALTLGQVTGKPVRTQFGWHVIKLAERRAIPVPDFEEAEEELREEVAQRAIAALVRQLRGKIHVQTFKMDGTPELPSGIRLAPR